ncbi:MAG: adenosylcobinamide-phosphate synthase CbiB [Firmicutes bacterium]|nr:adenosylcobinamide-phosphate synthase CbiB [Bacillota bacterium]MCL5040597.1 adenosylcobinamide-phosphate synthase CbiB [Bacillota bacterium]
MFSQGFLTAAAYLVDLLVGDPPFLTHPVVYMGRFISWLEGRLWVKDEVPWRLRLKGVFLALSLIGLAYQSTALLLQGIQLLHPWLAQSLEIWMISTTIAARSLDQAATRVYLPLMEGDLVQARTLVGKIVGRDTGNLPEREIVRATIETVAENTVDGVLSPLFYAFLGGAPLAMAFKAISTLDSMVGYRDERYLHFGWASARLDDLANYLPARISLPLLALAANLLALDGKRAWVTARRDARKHPSPNGGIPEAAVAGALGVQLGGVNYYDGKPAFRALLGEPRRDLERKDIRRAVRLMYLSSLLLVLLWLGLDSFF